MGMNSSTTTGTFSNVATGWHNVQVSKSGYQTLLDQYRSETGCNKHCIRNPFTKPAGRVTIRYFHSGWGQPVCGYHLPGIYEPDRRQPRCRYHILSSSKNPDIRTSHKRLQYITHRLLLSQSRSHLFRVRQPVILRFPLHPPVHQSISIVLTREKHVLLVHSISPVCHLARIRLS